MAPQLNNVFQIAYATGDAERAAALIKDRFGTGPFLIMDPPGGMMRIALAYAGSTMYELIQPLDDTSGLYANWIKGIDGFALRHHHLGMLVDTAEDLAAIRAAHVAAGSAIATEGAIPGALDFLYVDTTAVLGHYLEYVRLDDGGRAMFAQVEGSPFRV